MAIISPIGTHSLPPSLEGQEKQENTKTKVLNIAKRVLTEVLFWGGSALAVMASVIVIRAAFAHPVTAIATIILGCLAYRNRDILIYNGVMYSQAFKNCLGKVTWFSKMDDHISFGALPLENKQHLQELKNKEKITHILSLNEDFELSTTTLVSKPISKKSWESAGIHFKQIPIKEVSSISFKAVDEAVDHIASIVNHPEERIYLHCDTGTDRSAMVMMCYLIKHQSFTAQEALEHVRGKRPSVNVHLNKIHEYQGYLLDHLKKEEKAKA
jgi:protein-tyrosine phosphatase